MNLLQIRNIIDYILSLQQNPIKLTRERFTDILGLSSLMYFEEQLRQKNWDNLKPFIKIKGDHLSPAQPVTNGVMEYPSDFFQSISVVYKTSSKDTHGNVTDKIRPVEKVDNEMFDDRCGNAVTDPTLRNPIINFQEVHARVRPKQIRRLVFTYITLPIPPVYVQRITNGVNAYNSSASTELQWSEDCQVNVLQIALQHLGIKMNRADIFQVMEAQQQKEKELTK
jgi:hypothetical protein